MSATLDKTINPIKGIPPELIQKYNNMDNGRLLSASLISSEIAAIEGYFFRSFHYITVPSSSSKFIKFTAPSSAVQFALLSRSIGPNIAGLKYNIYEGADDIVTTGSPWDIFNENGNSLNESGSEFLNVATIGALGTLSDTAFIPAGGTGQKSQGSFSGGAGYKIVPADTVLVLELENLANAINEVLVYFQWTEEPV